MNKFALKILNQNLRGKSLALRNFSVSMAKDPYDNIPEQILDLTKRKIYKQPGHPLSTLIGKIDHFFTKTEISDLRLPGEKFKMFSDFDPFVNVKDCFDDLGIPKDHVSRRTTDTYYKS
jgi:phenylalanyl-tRNA synthetase alpha chain